MSIQWLERTSLRRHGSCGWAGNSPAASAAPLSHTVESVGKAVFGKMVVNKIKYLRVGKWSNQGFSSIHRAGTRLPCGSEGPSSSERPGIIYVRDPQQAAQHAHR